MPRLRSPNRFVCACSSSFGLRRVCVHWLGASFAGAAGARVEEVEDGMIIDGTGGDPLPGGATIATLLDHRIAMSMAVAALHCRKESAGAGITLDDASPVATSYPAFFDQIAQLQSGDA